MEHRVEATPEALALLDVLKRKHGPKLLFIQSCGCCDHSSVYCYKEGEYMPAPQDVLVGSVGGVPFYLDASQHALLKRKQIVIGAVKGDRSGDFSLDGPEGLIFRTETRALNEAEGTDPEIANEAKA